MLKLDRLEVSGFKSFVDPTEVEFSGGITAIVGPNGCGKSNVCDAITWALGEQSAKSMRGDTMEDVIFNGTEGRRPLGLAEVSLSLITPAGFPGSEDGRIALARRVFRSGESQYRLNGKLVRLKDFRDLLMDTGLGLRAYSVIEQGKIGMILSGKPQERRRLLEEAAGVTRYKARKRIAEVKLEEAQANLLRLHDIVAEIERNLRSLKRQAGAAKRLEEKRAEYAVLLRLVLEQRWAAISATLGELRTDIEAAQSQDAEAAAALHRDEARLSAEREQLEAAAAELGRRQREQAQRGAFIEGRQALIKGHRQNVEEIAARLVAGSESARQRAGEIEEGRRSLEELGARRGSLVGEHADAAEAVRRDDEAITAAEAAARDADEGLEALRAQLLASLAEVTHLRNQLHREQIESEKGAYRQTRLGDQLTLWSSQMDEASLELAAARQSTGEMGQRMAERERALAAEEGALRELAEKLEEERALLRRRDGELIEARQRRRVLAELSAEHGERRQAWRDALAAAGVSDARFLGDHLRPPAGWERSLDLYFGEIEDAVILDSEGEALDLAAALAASQIAGRVIVRGEGAIYPVVDETTRGFGPWAGRGGPRGLAPVEDPAIVARLADALGLESGLAAALPPAYLVENAVDARRLAARFAGVAFISRDRLWAQSGLLHLEGEKAQPGLLERQREAAGLAARVPRLEAEVTEIEAGIAAREAETKRRSAVRGALSAEVSSLRDELAAARGRLAELEARHQRLSVEHGTLTTEREEIERELVRISERERLFAEDLNRADGRHKELETGFDAAQNRSSEARSEREALRTAGAGRRGRLDLLAERLSGLDRETDRLQRVVENAVAQAAAWSEEAERLETRGADLRAAIETGETELQEALEARAGAESLLLDEATRLDEMRTLLRGLEQELQVRREERDGLRARTEELRIRHAALHQESEHVAATFREEFSEGPPTTPPAPDDRLGEWEVDLARCKEAIERLGPVNVLAGVEYDEQEERFSFLTTQRADVARSVESLKATIQEINQTSSARFLETFREVNVTFGRTFAELFRGGEAEMRLLDEDDLLESGIEIVARPPGKRTQNIMLLSGGEKALTAIALLFALFRAKPSPFCILDEVDAPLDDINTLRFVEMLEKMAGETQFIVITHNKLTMEAASRLYGVTMQERGVSKLVSVSLEEVQPEPEPIAATA